MAKNTTCKLNIYSYKISHGAGIPVTYWIVVNELPLGGSVEVDGKVKIDGLFKPGSQNQNKVHFIRGKYEGKKWGGVRRKMLFPGLYLIKYPNMLLSLIIVCVSVCVCQFAFATHPKMLMS